MSLSRFAVKVCSRQGPNISPCRLRMNFDVPHDLRRIRGRMDDTDTSSVDLPSCLLYTYMYRGKGGMKRGGERMNQAQKSDKLAAEWQREDRGKDHGDKRWTGRTWSKGGAKSLQEGAEKKEWKGWRDGQRSTEVETRKGRGRGEREEEAQSVSLRAPAGGSSSCLPSQRRFLLHFKWWYSSITGWQLHQASCKHAKASSVKPADATHRCIQEESVSYSTSAQDLSALTTQQLAFLPSKAPVNTIYFNKSS